MSALSLMILEEVSMSGHVLETSRFKMSLNILIFGGFNVSTRLTHNVKVLWQFVINYFEIKCLCQNIWRDKTGKLDL